MQPGSASYGGLIWYRVREWGSYDMHVLSFMIEQAWPFKSDDADHVSVLSPVVRFYYLQICQPTVSTVRLPAQLCRR